MQQDVAGNLTYSDTPLEHGQVVNVSEGSDSASSVQSSPELNNSEPTSLDATPPAVEEATSYTAFTITSPKDQENIQNQPTLPVDIKLDPKLRKGDKIQLMLDDKPIGDAAESTHITLGQLERGTHQLSAVIINTSQQVLQQTNPITIYVNRVNVNFKPGQSQSSGSTPPQTSASALSGISGVVKKLFN